MQAKRANRHKRLISFSGIDGAGKSTQIGRLCVSLASTGMGVRLIRFWDDVATLTRFREAAGHAVFGGETGIGTPSSPINRRDKNVRSWFMTAIRLCLYLADAISLRLLIRQEQRSGADVLIFDRFIYDELANLELQQPAMRAYARAITRMVPKPDISYLLDAEPTAARARKPEYPLEFLDLNRRSFLTLNRCVGALHVIAPMTADAVEREVLKVAIDEFRPVHGSNPASMGPQISGVR